MTSDHVPSAAEPTTSPRSRAPADDAAPAHHERARPSRRRPAWIELPLLIVLALVVAMAVQAFVARVFVVPTASMEPTLIGCSGCDNDRIAVDRLSYRFTEPRTGDIVVFRGPPTWNANSEAPEVPQSPIERRVRDAAATIGLTAPADPTFVKRVVAVQGQTVACCEQGGLTVDGRPVSEPYLAADPATQTPFAPVTLAPGELWVLGDNRDQSVDSRMLGPVPTEDVLGQVRAVLLPFSRIRTIP